MYGESNQQEVLAHKPKGMGCGNGRKAESTNVPNMTTVLLAM